MKNIFSTLLFCTICLISNSQVTVNLIPSQDNSNFNDNPNNASGLGYLYCGETCGAGLRRTLLQFDLSGIPAGSTITNVTLTVDVNNVGSATPYLYNLHPITTPWGEGTSLPGGAGGNGAPAIAPDATWLDAIFGIVPWTTPGGDYLASVASTPFAGIGSYVFPSNPTLVGMTQTWLDNPPTNNGFLMIGDEATPCSAKRMGSKDLGIAPIFSVTYMPPCIDPDVPTITSNPTMVCDGSDATLTITGNLNSATAWNVYTGLCGGTFVGSTAGATIVVTPTSPGTTYYIRGEGGCIIPGACGSITVSVGDVTPPNAICQNITVALDATGNATIVPGDLDGGSTDNCGTVSLSASQLAFTCADISLITIPANEALIITGVIDGPLIGGLPKAIEVYVAANIPDLSLYGLGSANNGGGTDGEEFTFPVVSATAGQYIYIASEGPQFSAWFGFAPDYINGTAPNINGDDAIELFYNGAVVDVFGDINLSGTGQPWEYLDGWAYRNDLTGPDGTVFTLGNWSFSGINALDGETSNATAATPFPNGSYNGVTEGVSVTLTVDDGNGNQSNCGAIVTVIDDMDPTAFPLPPLSFECITDVPVPDVNVITGEADNCTANPIVAFVSDVSDGNTCPESIIRSYSVTDDSGNSLIVQQIISINDNTNPTASNPVAINIECIGDVPAADILVVTDEADNCSASPLVTWVSDVSDGLTCPETITRTYSVTDDCGNAIMITQTITVNDVTQPTASNPADINVATVGDVPSPNSAMVIDEADNCAVAPVVVFVSDVSDGLSCPETITRTYSVTDACGNTILVSHNIIIAGVDVSTSLGADEVTITATNSSATSYTWIDCNNGNQAIPGETNQSFVATSNGNYAVIIDEGGCIDTSACVAISTIGLEEEYLIPISLYPNPAMDGEFVIEYEGTIISVSVRDALGRIIETPVNLTTGKVNVSNVQTGSYWVKVTTESGSVVKALVVHN